MAVDLESKASRRALRRLADEAYRRELGAELAKLEEEFGRWHRGEIDPFELSERIHRFHDGISRDLYTTYHYSRLRFLVSRAVDLGILERAEIPGDLLSALEESDHVLG